jgi:DNA modification methylase
MTSKYNDRLVSRLRTVDWDFVGRASESPFSAIHWHPARFVSQIPATLVGVLSQPGELVLDPFVGSGTTLLECQRLGRRSVGIDLNPISCLVSSAKTLAVSAKTIASHVSSLITGASIRLNDLPHSTTQQKLLCLYPATVQETKWYTKQVRQQLAALWSLSHSYRGTRRVLAEAAFSAILMNVCRETRHWGYICDNTTPKGMHGGNVLGEYTNILKRLSCAYEERDREIVARGKKLGQIERAKVVCADARDALRDLPSSSVDLVVTSPPYFGVCDYTKAQRLSMEWFGYSIEPLRQKEIGARSKRHRRAAGEEYVSEFRQILLELHRCMRKGRFCAIIMGQSASRRSVLKTATECIQSSGFELVLDMNRHVSSQRRQAPSVTGEHLYLLRS